ncbi:hypothetical protein FGG33_gp57 [Mycobacterium phage Benedict]|uniref:Uncharacterized protein n=1 Tax=Mycobacterium phage Benedict TaxID=2902890 RepID=G1EDI7_9CAUD|nr:hypothetical protein FGG33_gp57 [Mycobacterium phage Benedict]AEJ93477.1 hypothetical protein BENEDICT_40 [Mycobacterium phage Benedict]
MKTTETKISRIRNGAIEFEVPAFSF